MNIVLLEGLGVDKDFLDSQAVKLKRMGHTFISYEKNMDISVQITRSKNADVLMLANMPLKEEVIKECRDLKFIDVAFTGVDHIGMKEVRRRNIAVSNASGYATQAVAELCISFMIQLLRKVKQTEERCREGGTKDGLVGKLLSGKTVGIVGAGAIGSRTARLCKAFGCHVIVSSRRTSVNTEVFDEKAELEDLLKRSDIVSLHCPLTDETQNLIGKKQLACMKKSGILINTARGAVVDSHALAEALEEGRIAGAACDVFEQEPPLDQQHPLLHCPNIILTPHIAFSSEESMMLRADIVFDNLYSWLNGEQKNKI